MEFVNNKSNERFKDLLTVSTAVPSLLLKPTEQEPELLGE
jgi:hypothetical protein